MTNEPETILDWLEAARASRRAEARDAQTHVPSTLLEELARFGPPAFSRSTREQRHQGQE